MEHAKKFVLVPEQNLNKHIPSVERMSEFDMEMNKILKSTLSEKEKVRQFYDVLQKKMNMENFNSGISPQEKDDEKSILPIILQDPPLKSLILESVPKPMRKNTANILNVLQTHPDIIQWNKNGEILIHKELIPKSNIVDLIHLLFSKTFKPIQGIEQFMNALVELNIPRNYIKNTTLNHVNHLPEQSSLKNLKLSPSTSSEEKKKSKGRKSMERKSKLLPDNKFNLSTLKLNSRKRKSVVSPWLSL